MLLTLTLVVRALLPPIKVSLSSSFYRTMMASVLTCSANTSLPSGRLHWIQGNTTQTCQRVHCQVQREAIHGFKA